MLYLEVCGSETALIVEESVHGGWGQDILSRGERSWWVEPRGCKSWGVGGVGGWGHENGAERQGGAIVAMAILPRLLEVAMHWI